MCWFSIERFQSFGGVKFLLIVYCSLEIFSLQVIANILVGGMVHIKEPLLLIGKSSPCGGSGFPLTLSE